MSEHDENDAHFLRDHVKKLEAQLAAARGQMEKVGHALVDIILENRDTQTTLLHLKDLVTKLETP